MEKASHCINEINFINSIHHLIEVILLITEDPWNILQYSKLRNWIFQSFSGLLNHAVKSESAVSKLMAE